MKVEIISKSLGKICDVRDGTHDSPKYVENGFYLLTSKNFSSGKISYEGANKISIEDYNAINKRSKVDIGDIVMPMIGTIGSPVIISQEPNFAIKNVALIKRNENVCMNYICAFLASSFFEKAIKSSKRGGTQKFVSLGDLRNLKLPLPPIAEQKRIAEILDRTQSLISKRKEAIAKLETLTQSIFIEIFGDPVANSKGWIKLPFGEVCATRLGKMLDKNKQTGEHRRLYLRNANVQWFRFDLNDVFEMNFNDSELNILRLKYGDLLICEGGESGRTAIWRDEFTECYYQKTLHRARPKSDLANPEYLARLFWFLAHYGGLSDHITSATIAHLTGEKLKLILIPVPPLPLQKEFAQRVEAVEKLKATHHASLSELQALFASLQHRAFRGEL